MIQWISHFSSFRQLLPELLENVRYVVAVFGQVPGGYQDVIDVNFQEAMEELLEHFVHEPL